MAWSECNTCKLQAGCGHFRARLPMGTPSCSERVPMQDPFLATAED
jgi:hypothetical protein